MSAIRGRAPCALGAHLLRRGLGQPLVGGRSTGSHEASIDALIRGDADCGSIDETVWDREDRP
jgi:hypothetical protein